MIAVPVTQEQVKWCHDFLEIRGGMWLSEHAQFLTWSRDGAPKWVVGFDDWIGSTCQLYMASVENGTFPPLGMVKAVFRHAFEVLRRSHVFGIVNGDNKRAMRFDEWLGFKEILRIPGAHQGGGDIVVFQMTPATCRWIPKEARDGVQAPT